MLSWSPSQAGSHRLPAQPVGPWLCAVDPQAPNWPSVLWGAAPRPASPSAVSQGTGPTSYPKAGACAVRVLVPVPCAWDQHVRAAVVSGLPCGNTRSLLEKVLTRSPRLVDSGAEPSAGAGRAARHSPGLVTPSPLLTAVASAGPRRPLSWVLTEATGQVQYSVSTVKAIWSSQSQPVLTKIVPF